jgi:hypothetical protein
MNEQTPSTTPSTRRHRHCSPSTCRQADERADPGVRWRPGDSLVERIAGDEASRAPSSPPASALHRRRRHQGHGRRLRPRRRARPRGSAWPLNRSLRKLETCGKPVRGRHQRPGARRRPGSLPGLPLPRAGRPPEGGARPARGQHRPAARRRRHPAPAAADRHRTPAADRAGQPRGARRGAEARHRARTGARRGGRERARRWLLESASPVQPWDKKGFKVPGGAGASPEGWRRPSWSARRWSPRKTPAQLPGADRDPVGVSTKAASCRSTRPEDRVAVLRSAAGRPGGAQHDAHAVRQQGRGRQAGAPAAGRESRR